MKRLLTLFLFLSSCDSTINIITDMTISDEDSCETELKRWQSESEYENYITSNYSQCSGGNINITKCQNNTVSILDESVSGLSLFRIFIDDKFVSGNASYRLTKTSCMYGIVNGCSGGNSVTYCK